MPTTMCQSAIRHVHTYAQYWESPDKMITVKSNRKIGSRSPRCRPVLPDAPRSCIVKTEGHITRAIFLPCFIETNVSDIKQR